MEKVSKKKKRGGGVVKKNMYIHYGAFSKNYSLGGQMLKFYRYLRIGIHNGYIHVHKQKLFAAFIRVLSKSFYLILRMSRFDKERLTFNFKVDKTL